MKYHSTRSKKDLYNGAEAIIAGICDDGGLFVPQEFPQLNVTDLVNKSYSYIAERVLSLFLTDYDENYIKEIVAKIYSTDRFAGGAGQMKRVSGRLCFLELWHGPTYAFKDYALQILAPLLCEAKRIKSDNKENLVLVATSGDTGSAALYGFSDVEGTRATAFYPHGGVSMVQERQMLEAAGDNLNVYAVKGNFDDIQTAVKKVFSSECVLTLAAQNNIKLSSANSINLGRLLPQICYYFSSYCELLGDGLIKTGESVDYSVPTGNFGDILAGYYAKMMGLPIGKLICASNKNRILTDFFETGVYDTNREFYLTSSPSMDILVSSNLERLLYHESGDAEYVSSLMNDLRTTGKFEISKKLLVQLNKIFFSSSADDSKAAEVIKETEKLYQYVCDPHTAVALSAAQDYNKTGTSSNQVVILSTASPYKFPAEVMHALTNMKTSDKTAIETLDTSFPWFPAPKGIKDIIQHESRVVEVIEVSEIEQLVSKLIKE